MAYEVAGMRYFPQLIYDAAKFVDHDDYGGPCATVRCCGVIVSLAGRSVNKMRQAQESTAWRAFAAFRGE